MFNLIKAIFVHWAKLSKDPHKHIMSVENIQTRTKQKGVRDYLFVKVKNSYSYSQSFLTYQKTISHPAGTSIV